MTANGNDMPRKKPDPDLIDDEAPEATEQWFARARPAAQVLPEILGGASAGEMLKPRRGRPPLVQPRERVNIRLDADIVQSFKDGGAGWQTRINQALREWLKGHPRGG